MPPLSYNSVLIIAGISVLVPVVLGLLPRLPVPGAVLMVIAGIVVGPSVLNWARIDEPVQVLSTLGLGMLLFLAGLEIDVERLRTPMSRLAGLAFGLSVALGLGCGFLFWVAGQATEPVLLAIILMSTSAGLLLPLLKDAGEADSAFGQLIMTASAMAEVVPIMLLSLLFSASSKTPGAKLLSLAIFAALTVLIGLALFRIRRVSRLDRMLDYLEKRSGQLRLRAALTLALGCGVLAYRFGFAGILGAFAAGLLVRIVEFSGREPNREFLIKLEGIGFGFLVPIFFISTGVAFQLKGLVSHPAALAEVPLFLLALLVVRGAPALLYAPAVGRRRAAAGGLLQATTLTFVIVATDIGQQTGKLTTATADALVAAGLLSAALFPAAAGRLLAGRGQGERRPARATDIAEAAAAIPQARSPGHSEEKAERLGRDAHPWRVRGDFGRRGGVHRQRVDRAAEPVTLRAADSHGRYRPVGRAECVPVLHGRGKAAARGASPVDVGRTVEKGRIGAHGRPPVVDDPGHTMPARA